MSLSLQPIDLSKLGWMPSTKDQTNEESGLSSLANELSTPLSSLTTVSVDGTGSFDVLMRATKLHLNEEYNAQRITGQEYATVYLGALAAVLQTATQFLLNEQQVHKINAEIGLTRQKTVTELANTDDNIPVGLGFNHVPAIPECIEPVVCYVAEGPPEEQPY